MTQFICKDCLTFLNSEQKSKLNLKFRSPDRQVMPHDLAVSLGIKLSQANAIIVVLNSSGLCNSRLLIYHNCSEPHVGSIPFGVGFPTLPWECPECGAHLENYNEMSFGIILLTKENIEFI